MQPVNQADVEAAIASEHYFTAAEGARKVRGLYPLTPLELLTFCVLVLKNGHTVTGESYCQDPDKFDAETGRQWARKAAVEKLWPMVVYARRGEVAAAAVDPEAAADVQDAS